MLPYVFHVGKFAVPTYGLMAAIGLLAALYVVVKLAPKHGVDPDKGWNLVLIAILSALVGAKILFVIHDWDAYAANPRRLFSLELLQAGGVFYGGLLAAIVACVWYVRRTGMPGLKTADIFAPGIALGHSFGRLGCLAAGCCYGRPTDLPWSIKFTNPLAAQFVGTPLGVHLHPTQLYEFGVELGNFFLLLWLLRHKQFDGQVMGAYLFLYGLARFFIEFFRGDPGRATVFGGLVTGTQLISVLLVIAGGALWIRRPGQGATGAATANTAQ
jgi:phosphatidylglycerol:prolipoprotein diacylglycerol transferase